MKGIKFILPLIFINIALSVENSVFYMFDDLTPNTFYKSAHKTCAELWSRVEKPGTTGDLNRFLVNKLLQLNVCCALQKRHVLEEDLDYLLNILDTAKGQYLKFADGSKESCCIEVLFEKMSVQLQEKMVQKKLLPNDI